jgi:hypothetical protein
MDMKKTSVHLLFSYPYWWIMKKISGSYEMISKGDEQKKKLKLEFKNSFTIVIKIILQKTNEF